MNIYYSRFSLWRATWEACSGNLEKQITGTIPAFALGPRKTKRNLCRDGRSQERDGRSQEMVLPVSTCGRDLLRGWWRPIGLIMGFIKFTASVRYIMDTSSYSEQQAPRAVAQCGLAVIPICCTVHSLCLCCIQHCRFPQPHKFIWDSCVSRFAPTYLLTVNSTGPLAVQKI
jgi:hypothetical protein